MRLTTPRSSRQGDPRAIDDLDPGYRARGRAPAQRAIAQRFSALARSGPPAMSAIWSLTGVDRTWYEQPVSVENDRGDHQDSRCHASEVISDGQRDALERSDSVHFALLWQKRHYPTQRFCRHAVRCRDNEIACP